MGALETLGGVEPPVLTHHGAAIVQLLEDEDGDVGRVGALETMAGTSALARLRSVPDQRLWVGFLSAG